MNITSMTGRELFNTLFGRDTARQVTEEAKEEFMSTVKPDENGKYDRVMLATAENTENIDPDISSVTALYESGMGGIYKLQRFQAPFSDNELAEHFGAMGARLDEAFKAGKFTEDEYNELNAGITELATKTKDFNDEKKATMQFYREQHREYLLLKFENPTFDDTSFKPFTKEERTNAIQKILNRPGFVTSIETLLGMINEYRQNA
jgi:hypothetical protein